MYNVSSTFLTKIAEPSRYIKAKVQIGAVTIDESIIKSFEVETSMGGDRLPTIGSSIAGKLNLSVLNDTSLPSILINTPIIPYIAVQTGIDPLNYGELQTMSYNNMSLATYYEIANDTIYEWIPLGKFYANTGDITRNKLTIDIECFDRMPDLDTLEYTSTLTFPATIQQMISEIATQHSMVFETQTLPTVSFDTKPEGTVRQVITYIASLISRNVVVNRTGKFEFRFTNTIAPETFTFNGDSYVDFSLLSDSMVKISQLSVKVSEDTSIVSGDATGISLVFENPAITSQAILDNVLARVYPLTFNAYTMTCQGFPHVDCGDSVRFTDVDGVVRTIIIGEHKLRYAGGLKSEFKCEAPKEESKDVTITSGSAIKHAVKNFAKTFEGAVKNATNLITGNEGGDLIILSDETGKPYELVILGDTPVGQVGDIDTAMKVWRWNAGGLGYSSTGYNGSYSTAITSDGQINADFIITGEMSASLVRTGLLSSEDGKTWINMNDGKFSFANGAISYDGSTLNITANSIKIGATNVTTTSDLATKEEVIVKQNTAPSHSNGKLWLDTSVTPNVLKRSTGSDWVKVTPTTAGEVGAYSSGDGSALATRVSTAEQKITPQAITATVETTSTVLAKKSEVTQTATDLTVKFSQIGGRNLIKNSNFANGEYNWDGIDGGIKEDGDLKYITIVGNFDVSQAIHTDEGQTYTISALVRKSTSENSRFRVKFDIDNADTLEVAVNNSEWKRISTTMVATTTGSQLLFFHTRNTFPIDMTELQIEKGQVATDWSPHPSELTGATYSFDGDKFKIGGTSGDSVEHTNSLSKYTHSDGSYTQIGVNGMERFVSGTGRKYHYLVHAMTFIQGASGTVRWLQLPDEFKGKQFSIYLAIADTINAESTRNAIQRIVVTKDANNDIDYVNARVPIIAYKTVVDMVSPFTSLINTVQGMLLAIY